jgi:protein tyrosine/serine phosphatase
LQVRGVVLAALSAVLFCAGFAFWRISVHNEDVVEPGQLYRSAQLTAPELQDEITRNGIRTVLNLRGENKASLWYQKELSLCDEDGVRHIDVHMSGKHLPTPVEVDKLLDALQTAPRPILVHCLNGSDRTGLASCIFLIDQEHVPWKQAEDALSLRFGHFAIHPYFRMDEFIQLYGQSTDPSINDWIRKIYPSVYVQESHETKWDEMTEPLELLVHGRLD